MVPLKAERRMRQDKINTYICNRLIKWCDPHLTHCVWFQNIKKAMWAVFLMD